MKLEETNKKAIEKIIIKNMEDNKITSETISKLKRFFKTLDQTILEQYFKENFEYIIKNSIELPNVIDEIIEIGNLEEFVINYLNNNFKNFSDKVPSRIIFKNPKIYFKKNKEHVKEYLIKNKKDYIFYILTRGIDYIHTSELDKINEVVVMIVDEILEHEKLELTDIKSLPTGAYSYVVEIGSKVVKVGYERKTYQIPNTSVLLQPLIRVNLSDISTVKGTIEVMEKVKTKKNFTEEEKNILITKAKNEGVELRDLKSNNIGILLKNNTIHWNKAISLDKSPKGISGEVNEILKKGDLVLLDSDYIYNIEDNDLPKKSK